MRTACRYMGLYGLKGEWEVGREEDPSFVVAATATTLKLIGVAEWLSGGVEWVIGGQGLFRV